MKTARAVIKLISEIICRDCSKRYVPTPRDVQSVFLIILTFYSFSQFSAPHTVQSLTATAVVLRYLVPLDDPAKDLTVWESVLVLGACRDENEPLSR